MFLINLQIINQEIAMHNLKKILKRVISKVAKKLTGKVSQTILLSSGLRW